jgi:protein SCO1/2
MRCLKNTLLQPIPGNRWKLADKQSFAYHEYKGLGLKYRPVILLASAVLLALALPFMQGLVNAASADGGFYGYKTDIPVPALAGASVPADGLNVVFFGYRSCGTVCPLQLVNLQALEQKWSGQPVHFVFVTLDPENDSQQALDATMGALGQNFRAVRPASFRQAQVLAGQYGDFAARQSGSSVDINHGARLYVVTEDNRRQLLYATPELDLKLVNADLTRLLEQARMQKSKAARQDRVAQQTNKAQPAQEVKI